MDDQRQAVARHGFTARATATKFREIRAGLTFGFLRQPTNAERQTRLWSAVTKMSSIFCFCAGFRTPAMTIVCAR